MFVDTHTHLYLENFDEDRKQVVEKAIELGVKYMLLPNIDSDSFDDMESLHHLFPKNCLAMMGLHPTSVKENYETELHKVEQEISTGKYIAVGEIGIDLYWDKSFEEQQKDAFRRQLKLAKKYKLPVSIHTRDAFEQIYTIVKEELTDGLKGVFHCFTGTAEEAKQIMETGFKMGIGGVLTFKNSKLQEVIKSVPMEYLVLETDAPFLTPTPFRGKRNESAYIPLIAQKLAEIKGISLEEVAAKTTENAVDVFQIKN
ncbi:MAG TPA: TatD family hydrolase [Bacteroidales bacterium]